MLFISLLSRNSVIGGALLLCCLGLPFVASAAETHATAGPTQSISTSEYGVVGDGSTNDAAAFRAMWDFLRQEWYDHQRAYRVYVDGNIRLDAPTEDLPGVAAFIMDFPGAIIGNPGNTLSVGALSSTTMALFQVGTWASRDVGVRSLTGLKIDGGDACAGITFADLFQGAVNTANLYVENCSAEGQYGIRLVNVQEAWFQNLTVLHCHTGLLLAGGASVTRAEGANGTYSASGGAAHNNNNQCNGLFVQAPVAYGIRITQGENCSFSGLVQGNWTQWALSIEGGDDLRFYDMWFETPSAAHNEIRSTASYRGNLLFENIHGTSTGCEAEFSGGRNITWLGGAWYGRIRLENDAIKFITDDGPRGSGNRIRRNASLDHLTSIPSDDGTLEESRNVIPFGKQIYRKQTIPAATSETLYAFGNASSDDDSKGGWGVLHIRNDATGAQVMTEFFFTAQGAYPACTTAITDKIGSQAAIPCSFTIGRIGSSPQHQVVLQLHNKDEVNSISYELFLFPTLF